jgi:hypothetical protein
MGSNVYYLAVVVRDGKGDILNAWSKKVDIGDVLVAKTN